MNSCEIINLLTDYCKTVGFYDFNSVEMIFVLVRILVNQNRAELMGIIKSKFMSYVLKATQILF